MWALRPFIGHSCRGRASCVRSSKPSCRERAHIDAFLPRGHRLRPCIASFLPRSPLGGHRIAGGGTTLPGLIPESSLQAGGHIAESAREDSLVRLRALARELC